MIELKASFASFDDNCVHWTRFSHILLNFSFDDSLRIVQHENLDSNIIRSFKGHFTTTWLPGSEQHLGRPWQNLRSLACLKLWLCLYFATFNFAAIPTLIDLFGLWTFSCRKYPATTALRLHQSSKCYNKESKKFK